MKYLFYLGFLLIIITLFHQCANPSNPSGGPKDTIPPEFLSSNPPFGKTNFSSKEITMIFNEKVTAQKLKQNLLITPTYDGEYTSFVKKNEFTIKFEKPFNDSTTYTFNFFEGITDITENNPAQNLVYVFSTGDFLDSLQISGQTRDLLTQEPMENITVALFKFSDTLDVTKHKPLYFTKTDEDGQFLISFIKRDKYKLFAFLDENRNLLVNYESENYGFLPDSINLQNNLDSLVIDMVKIDASYPELISSRPFSNYFDIRYNKEINKYSINALFDKDSLLIDSLGHQLANENKNIRIYHNIYLPKEDSLSAIVQVADTLENFLIDTVAIRFNERTPKKEEFIISNNTPKPWAYTNEIFLSLKFNKPVYTTINTDSIFFQFDTLYQSKPDTIIYNFNYSKNQVNITLPLNWDTLENSILNSLDTTVFDSAQMANFTLTKMNLYFGQSTFLSVEDDSSGFTFSFEKYNPEDFGILKVNLLTDKESYLFQLIDEKQNVIRSIWNIKEYTFKKLPLGSYSFRVLYDLNNDGNWSPGNITKDQYPEPVFLYNEFTELRPNFEILIDDFSF